MFAKGESTKSKILDAAGRLFTVKNFSDVTMKDVCEATGLSRGGLYRYFSSTSEMMIALMEQEQLRADQMAGDIPTGAKSAAELLDEFLSTHESFLTSRKVKLEIAMNQFALTCAAGCEANMHRLILASNRLVSIILKGQHEGVFRSGDAETMANHVIIFLGGLRAQVCLADYDAGFIDQQLAFIKSSLCI